MPIDLTKIKSAVSFKTPGAIADELTKANKKDGRLGMVLEEHDGRMSVMKSPIGSILSQPDFKMPSKADLEAMSVAVGLPWDPDYAERIVPFWGSDQRTDRHGDIVEQSWTFESFKTNPVLLNQHNWQEPPIGNVINWQVISRADADYTGPALLLLCLFATAEQSVVADSVYRLVKAKLLRTGSVGFYPGSMTWVQDDDERAALGLGRNGYIYQDNELLEYSMATIPANAGAYQLMLAAKSAGLLQAKDIAVIRESKRVQLQKSGATNSKWRAADISYLMFWKCAFPEIKLDVSKDVGEPLDVVGMMDDIDETEMAIAKGKGKKPKEDPEDQADRNEEEDDPDDVSVMDALGAMTDMMTKVHDKLGDHAAKMDDLAANQDKTHKVVKAIHASITKDDDDAGGAIEDQAQNPMDLLLAHAE